MRFLFLRNCYFEEEEVFEFFEFLFSQMITAMKIRIYFVSGQLALLEERFRTSKKCEIRVYRGYHIVIIACFVWRRENTRNMRKGRTHGSMYNNDGATVL